MAGRVLAGNARVAARSVMLSVATLSFELRGEPHAKRHVRVKCGKPHMWVGRPGNVRLRRCWVATWPCGYVTSGHAAISPRSHDTARPPVV
eukprot:1736663-Prymnesium_polylepis.2